MQTHRLTWSVILVCFLGLQAYADPMLSSWLTEGSTKYARIYTTTGNRSNGVSTTTWTGQTLPTYCGVHEINSSASWVYIKNSGLAPYIMGPWNNPNLPKNQGTSANVYRFPRTPTVPTNMATTGRTLTGMGTIGFLVDGVSIYNTADGFSYSFSNSKDASPNAGIGPGDGIWNRDAWPNEFISFDYALNHPQPSGQYHAHANPIGVRYLLGDNVNYDPTSKNYSENTSTTIFKHSPILGWGNDGIPIYGPYAYSEPTNPISTVRRMISGYVLRNGQFGTTDLSSTGRHSLPLWAQQSQNKTTLATNQYGPNITATYEYGHFSEDYDYLGDLGYAQGTIFDLNKYNARYCVTPEYPNGTWAYFTTITAGGTPWYPYNIGRWYLGTPTGGSTTTTVMTSDSAVQYFKGSASTVETWASTPVAPTGSTVTLTWNALEGGTYKVSASSDLSTWTELSPTVTATSNLATKVETINTTTYPKRFYKATRTSTATYDSTGY